jgi:hypothetical protein
MKQRAQTVAIENYFVPCLRVLFAVAIGSLVGTMVGING